MSDYILEMKNISKDFSGVVVLNNVSLKVERHEVHALVGENGAGKSTLMKILSGVYPKKQYNGDIFIDNQVQKYEKVKDSEDAGVGIIHQELELVPYMTIAENIFLGNHPKKAGFIDYNKLNKMAKELLGKVNLNIDPETLVSEIGVGKMQLVAIAKALSHKVKILVLDEPTAALTENETKNLLGIIKEIKKEGVSCIYISHKLNEVMEIADTTTVIRDGQSIINIPTRELDEEKIIKHMVGREIVERYPYREHEKGDTAFEVKNYSFSDISGKEIIRNVSFRVRKGEILGVAGLMGAGRTELIMSILGMMNGYKKGFVYLNGEEVAINSPKEAIDRGIGIVSEDRKKYGLVLCQNIFENITLSSLKKISKFGVINSNLEIKETMKQVNDFSIKARNLEMETQKLSGGNQQKVVLGKVLMSNPQVIFMDEPTRGIDVGAKHEIYLIINELVKRGVAIVMISSELPEVMGMSDRIIVMNEGEITGELSRSDASQEKVMTYCTMKEKK